MRLRTASAALALSLVGLIPLPASTPLMPLEEVRPGMVGVGRTVFEGTELQEFKVHILGVLRNVQGPRRDLILARLEGAPLADAGVAQGMSGSPVYIDGRLVGAVAYSIGAFPKEPIAGITPIAGMKEATALPRRAAAPQARLELPITPERLTAALSAASSRLTPFAARPSDVRAIGLPAAEAGRIGSMLRPISTPLLLGGFDPETVELVAGPFSTAGFTPMVTGSADRQAPQATAPLREGDAIGVSLVSGDLEMAATGTVTHIDGDRVYAFGHPFYNLGPAEFPMTRAYVHAVLPSLMTSFKISSLGETIGTMQQDRATAIAGTLGPGPKLIPMTVKLERASGSDTSSPAPAPRTFTYNLVNDQLFTPLLAYVAIFNTLASYERQFGAATFTVESRARIKGHTDLTVEDIFTGESPVLGAATAVAGPLTMLLSNDIEPITLEGLEVSISSAETPRSVSIERVWLDEIRPRAGRTMPLKVLTRSYRGEERISTVEIDIPSNVSGRLSILVTDGRQLNVLEQRELRRSLEPQTVAQMVRLLNDTRRNNRIYIRLLTGTPGAVVNGEAMTALPPSVLSVLESDRNGGSFAPIRSATVGEWELPMNSAVIGSRLLTVLVESGSTR
ncbi:MAG TPA: SpoIVB peptidase S55 domain-containing protein [Vicinamibacterales bacterium]|nr:SpoIVB peptidase S55 domain-containing protein [Vicinamibacterales bacterium]